MCVSIGSRHDSRGHELGALPDRAGPRGAGKVPGRAGSYLRGRPRQTLHDGRRQGSQVH